MTADYFAALSLPRRFDVDLSELEKSYFTAQRRFHPDRLVGKSADERQQAVSQSMLVNDAYNALKQPLKRAQHLLALAGVNHDSVKPGQELLMEIMGLREKLEDVTDAGALSALAAQNERAQADNKDALLKAFAGSDIVGAGQLTIRLSYLVKLADEIRLRGKSLV